MGFKTPVDTMKALETAGINKTKYTWGKLLLQGFFAGAYIAFGAELATIVGGGYTGDSPGLKKFLYGAVFPVGLVAVILTGSELFTGNTMAVIFPALSKKITWGKLFYNWSLAYLGNLLGSLFVAFFLCWLCNVYSVDNWANAARAIATGKMTLGFGKVFLRAIGCNWLVCLAVWQAIAATDMFGKIFAIWWPIMAFVALGFEHCVANMFFVPVGIMYGADLGGGGGEAVGVFIYNNLIPATLGNIIGGSFFMGFMYFWLFGEHYWYPRVAPPATTEKIEMKEVVATENKKDTVDI